MTFQTPPSLLCYLAFVFTLYRVFDDTNTWGVGGLVGDFTCFPSSLTPYHDCPLFDLFVQDTATLFEYFRTFLVDLLVSYSEGPPPSLPLAGLTEDPAGEELWNIHTFSQSLGIFPQLPRLVADYSCLTLLCLLLEYLSPAPNT